MLNPKEREVSSLNVLPLESVMLTSDCCLYQHQIFT